MTIIEAKNDNLRGGLGQCIAAMVAAAPFNQKEGNIITAAVDGAVTTGTAWRFLQLQGSRVTVDAKEYFIDHLDKILGIFKHILDSAAPLPAKTTLTTPSAPVRDT